MTTIPSADALFGDTFTDLDWARLLRDAYVLAQESPDPSTQNGAMIWSPEGRLLACDYNRFPDGVQYLPERWERPLKYEVIEHAERNAIFWAAARGRETLYSTMVAPWASCSDCARAIIQAGVKRLVRHQEATDHANTIAAPGKDWANSISIADQMLQEAEVEIIDISWDFSTSGIKIRHCGEVWTPGAS